MSTHHVSRVVVPSGYVEPHQGEDLALVKLTTPVTWSDYIRPICLPSSGALFPGGMLCHVTGWGDIRNNVPLHGVGTLQEVAVPIISQSSCQQMYNLQPNDKVDILYDMMCAGYQEGKKDSCQGDSGGPLVCQMVNKTWVQAGVVSFGLGCAQANQPGVYTKVSVFSDFIRLTIPEIRLYGRASHSWTGMTVVLVTSLSSMLVIPLLQ
ncbi:prostasin [Lampris incognitus]|uniref:prostasin n=1 Tax=Lampris incognitus TaxID=2546036 RepID=UPI0024B56006|nr:prostasin [Lampris incognitus]